MLVGLCTANVSKYCGQVNIHHVRDQGVDVRIINLHFYCFSSSSACSFLGRRAVFSGLDASWSIMRLVCDLQWLSGPPG